MEISVISQNNMKFWDELCGSHLARHLGVSDSSIASLKKFDDWYFDFYPYLFNHIPFRALGGKKVLEIGLGYGTVSQKLAEVGVHYTGLDIAAGPVAMVNQRLAQNNLAGQAVQGSILEPPFPENSFDCIVAVGCLHHTGNLQLAINHCHRLLKPGGKLIFMVYYAYSYRRFRMEPVLTIRNLLREAIGYRGVVGDGSNVQRAAYDASSDGTGAPHTDWISGISLKFLCREFSSFQAKIENIDQEPPFAKTPRERLLTSIWPVLMGLDIYATAMK